VATSAIEHADLMTTLVPAAARFRQRLAERDQSPTANTGRTWGRERGTPCVAGGESPLQEYNARDRYRIDRPEGADASMLDKLTIESFEPHVGTSFWLHTGANGSSCGSSRGQGDGE